MPRSLDEIPATAGWNQAPFDEAICWRGGSESQYMKHRRQRHEEPCKNCMAAAARAKEDRERRKANEQA